MILVSARFGYKLGLRKKNLKQIKSKLNREPIKEHQNITRRNIMLIQFCEDFIGQGHYGKVKSRSHHDVAHLQPLTNVPTKYQLPTPYGFRDIVWTRFLTSRSLRQGQIKVRP